MKDYLKEPLTEDEKNLIMAIIWRTAKKTKQRIFNNKWGKFVPIDDINFISEDEYDFVKIEIEGTFDSISVLTEDDKKRIVEYVDRVLVELSLYKIKIALTFDEKLVLFLCSFQHYPEKLVALMLQVNIRRIKYLKESFKKKKIKICGGNNNV